MNARLQTTTLRTWLLATALTTVQSIVIREPDTWTLCDQSNGSCDWPSEQSAPAKRHATLDELLAQLADSPRAHIAGQLTAYSAGYPYLRSYPLYERSDQQRPFLPGGWKRQLGLSAWDPAPASHRPLNGDKRARYAFSSWGGKRAATLFDEAPLKREPAFSSWGGKRSQFYNWGGKRALEAPQRMAEGSADGEHSVMKRAVRDEAEEPTAVAKRLCVSDTANLRQLLDEFVEWSRKQPEQKKASLYTKMMNVRTLHGAESPSRRAGAFYPWGGKRNSKPE